MEIKDHIDKIFSARLKEHSLAPPKSAWQAIEDRLDKRKPGNRGIRFFIPILLLAVAFTAIGFFLLRDHNTATTIAQSSLAESESQTLTESVAFEERAMDLDIVNAVGNVSTDVAKTSATSETRSNQIIEKKSLLTKTFKSPVTAQSSTYHQNANSLENQLAAHTTQNISAQQASNSDEKNSSFLSSNRESEHEIATTLPTRVSNKSFSTALLAQRDKNRNNYDLPRLQLSPFKAKYTFRSQPGRYYLDMIFSTDFSIKTLKEKDDRFMDFVDQRIETERLFFAYMGALRLSRVFDSGFALRTGINYSQVTEIFSYKEYQSENYLRMIDVPVIAGWEFDYDNFSLTVNGGLVVNAIFIAEGMILNEDLEVVEIQNEDVFKNNIGASIYLSTGLNYDVGQSTQLIFEPYYRRMLGQVSKKDYPIRQRYTFVGLQFGLRYKF